MPSLAWIVKLAVTDAVLMGAYSRTTVQVLVLSSIDSQVPPSHGKEPVAPGNRKTPATDELIVPISPERATPPGFSITKAD